MNAEVEWDCLGTRKRRRGTREAYIRALDINREWVQDLQKGYRRLQKEETVKLLQLGLVKGGVCCGTRGKGR